MTTLSTSNLGGNPDEPPVISEELLCAQLQGLTEKLLSSEIYQQALKSLQDKLGTVVEEVQVILQQLGQEAIRFTLEQSIAAAYSSTLSQRPREFISVTETPACDLSTAMQSANSTPISLATPAVPTPPIAITPSETPQAARDRILQEIGQTFQQVRQAKGMTLNQLHDITYVPLHHLKSLEAGQIARLPEDVFLLGFIQRIGNALGLNGKAIADQVPLPIIPHPIVSPWHNSLVSKPLLTPVHLYISYAVLMAGAVGGLTLLNQPRQIVNQYPDIIPQDPDMQPLKGANLDMQQQGKGQTPVTANIAPPEMF